MWLELEALDVWFFRDGRPFEAGEAHWVRSQFPPPPGTVVGAARAILLDAFFKRQSQPVDLEGYTAWLRSDRSAAITAYREALRRFGVGADVGTPGPGEQGYTLRGPFVLGPVKAGPAEEPATLEPLFPLPLDLQQTEASEAEPGRVVRLEPLADERLRQLEAAGWNGQLLATGQAGNPAWRPRPLVGSAGRLNEVEAESWLTLESLRQYLTSQSPNVRTDEPTKTEPRVGIALQPTRTAREGFLYRLDVIRPKVQPWAEVEGDAEAARTRLLAEVLPDADGCRVGDRWWLPFGGERRASRACWLEGTAPVVTRLRELLRARGATALGVLERAVEQGWVRIVLLQPAVFEHGWLPDGISPQDGRFDVDGHAFVLESAAVGKPQAISGWDLSTNRPKPLRRTVPAGSVYHVRYADSAGDRQAAFRALIDRYHGTGNLQAQDADRRAGYGLSVVGACWPEG